MCFVLSAPFFTKSIGISPVENIFLKHKDFLLSIYILLLSFQSSKGFVNLSNSLHRRLFNILFQKKRKEKMKIAELSSRGPITEQCAHYFQFKHEQMWIFPYLFQIRTTSIISNLTAILLQAKGLSKCLLQLS